MLICNVPLDNIFKLGGSVAGELFEWIQVGIDLYIPPTKYQVKPH